MATAKDLLEAQTFSRRRLVAAFVAGGSGGSGAAGAPEGEPPRPGRAVLGGLALAVLLVAGAAASAVLAPRTPSDWASPGLVLGEETGQAYVILDPEDPGPGNRTGPVLSPVLNVVSARLLLGAEGSTPRILPEQTLHGLSRGATIGIAGAPDGVPDPDRLRDAGWTACAEDGRGLTVELAERPAAAPVPGRGILVRTETGAAWVIAPAGSRTGEPDGAYAYRVPDRGDHQDSMLGELGFGPRQAAPVVPDDFVRLFPRGGDLDLSAFGLGSGLGSDLGRVARPVGPGLPGSARVGDYVVAGDRALLVTSQGLVPLEGWALSVYRYAVEAVRGTPAGEPVGRRFERETLPGGVQVAPPYLAAHWPREPVQALIGEPCAVLDPAPDRPPVVSLGTVAVGEAVGVAVGEPTEAVPSADSPTRAGSRQVSVEPGLGSYVVAGGWDGVRRDGDGEAVVAATGGRYPLADDGAAERLGYGDHEPVVVPDPWLQLFPRGVTLSVAAARCPVAGELGSGPPDVLGCG